MTDNVAITPGTGASIATDDVGGNHYQRVKLDIGGDGVSSPVAAGNPLPVAGAVTVASLPLPTGAALDASVTALSAKFGALGQATMSGSAPVVLASNQSAIPVTGTFWQATQPVSGTVAVSGSVAVTGTFWQATQPVSGTVTVGNASLAVTGTFWQATQPVSIAATVAVSGPLTDTQLRATAVPVSLTSTTITGTVAATQSGTWNIGSITTLPTLANVTTVATVTNLSQLGGQAVAMGTGVRTAGTQRVTIATDDVVAVTGTFNPSPTPEASATFRGRVTTFRTLGRAGTTGQKLFALHNATGSTKVVHINQITVDLYQTVVKAVTVPPPIIRIHRFTAIPTNGTVLTKVAKDTNLSSNASVTAWGDASADGTGSATTLTVTIPANSCLTQEFAPRLITAAGYEMFDRTEMLVGFDIVLRALEGVVVNLDYTAATQNPVTDMWIVGCDWWEV